MPFEIHSSAVVDEGASLGAGTKIWHFSHVCAGAVIGERVSIGQNVFIANTVKVGNDCKIRTTFRFMIT